MKSVLFLIICLCLSDIDLAVYADTKKDTARPNIIIFLTDDSGLMDTSVPFLTGPDGEPEIHPLNKIFITPALERLANQGTRFETFYANSVCSPSRASILTGQSAARHHITQWINPATNNAGGQGAKDWRWEGLTSQDRILPAIFREAGYRTIHVGKGHLAPRRKEGERPDRIGYDISIGANAAGQPGSYYGTAAFRGVPDLKKYHGQDIYLDEALTLEMKAAIGNAVEEEKPFFAFMAYYAPHAPFQPNRKYLEYYKDAPISDKGKAYATMMHTIDVSVGDVLDHLESLGVAENTLVLFLSDNGGDSPMGRNHAIGSSAPLRGKKATHYEGGMRVPFIAAWARPDPTNPFQQLLPIAAGHHSREVANITDIAPTLLAAVGIEEPGRVFDGINIAPALAGKSLDRDPVWLMHYPHSHRSSYFTVYREGDWKLIYHYTRPAENRYELFNLKEDRSEQKNLAGEHPEMVKNMLGSMTQALSAAGAQFPRESTESDALLRPVMP